MRQRVVRLCVLAVVATLPGCAFWNSLLQGDVSRYTTVPETDLSQFAADPQVQADAGAMDYQSSGAVRSRQHNISTMAANAALFEDDNLPAEDSAYLTRARELYAAISTTDGLRDEQHEQLLQGKALLSGMQGREAFRVLSALSSEVSAQRMTYTLLQNNALERMTRQTDIYANPWMWSQRMTQQDQPQAAAMLGSDTAVR